LDGDGERADDDGDAAGPEHRASIAATKAMDQRFAISLDAPARSRTWIYRLGGGRLIHWTTRARPATCGPAREAIGHRWQADQAGSAIPARAAPTHRRAGACDLWRATYPEDLS